MRFIKQFREIGSMQKYNQKQNSELRKKVLQSLIVASTAYVCTFGGTTQPGHLIIPVLIL